MYICSHKHPIHQNEKQVAKELAKKTKGKGLSVLSGKALFEYDASLFVDDEEATDEKVDVSKVRWLVVALFCICIYICVCGWVGALRP